MSHTCSICKRELPDSAFYPTYLKRYQYQCKECQQKKNKKYQEEIKELDNNDFNRFYGGYIVAILNHIRPREYKYTIKGTNGYMVQTNDLDYFKKKLNEIT